MDQFEDFESVFGTRSDIAYGQQTIDEVLRNRRALEHELFFDRLLKALGVNQGYQLYPPRSNLDLRTLHNRIVSTVSPDHYKHSSLYYILKDLDHSHHTAERFARACFLPSKYQIFMDGLWFLDRLKIERSLDYLAEPALIPTFPEEILHVLCQHAPKDDPTLPLAYFHSVSPAITSNKVLEAFFRVLCKASITEAFHFSRGYGEIIHRLLVEKLIEFVLTSPPGDRRVAQAKELLSLPFDESEELWFQRYLNEGKGRTLYQAKDTALMRKIAVGGLRDITSEEIFASGQKIDGFNWVNVNDSVKQEAEFKSGPLREPGR